MKSIRSFSGTILLTIGACVSLLFAASSLRATHANPLSEPLAYEVMGGQDPNACYKETTEPCAPRPPQCGDAKCVFETGFYEETDEPYAEYRCPANTKGITEYKSTYTNCVADAKGPFEIRVTNPTGEDVVYCWKERLCRLNSCVPLTDGSWRCAEGVQTPTAVPVAPKCKEDPNNNRCPPSL